MDPLRNEYDTLYDRLVAQQNMFIRRTVAAKREEVWVEFDKLVRPYYEDAIAYRLLQKAATDYGKIDANRTLP